MNSELQTPNSELKNEIRNLVAKIIKLSPEKVDPNANLFTDLGVDSLLGVEIFAQLDKKYQVDIPEAELQSIKTLNDLTAMVEQYRLFNK
ncbi:MAG TPA: acyl carrier protein [Candidatus Sulfotelmatobacter sp.]|nr:acyl carrier protein [Candidatus Sulfotelmatobacter sp.]